LGSEDFGELKVDSKLEKEKMMINVFDEGTTNAKTFNYSQIRS